MYGGVRRFLYGLGFSKCTGGSVDFFGGACTVCRSIDKDKVSAKYKKPGTPEGKYVGQGLKSSRVKHFPDIFLLAVFFYSPRRETSRNAINKIEKKSVLDFRRFFCKCIVMVFLNSPHRQNVNKTKVGGYR
jgi:hypothetical protein